LLTRLKVSGFKNLRETEVRFGPLTCIAGLNAVGKSNLFDAIHFLSLLADYPFVEAARRTRGGQELTNLFSRGGDGLMRLECDLLVPESGHDDFQQPAVASQTFLEYHLDLRLVQAERGAHRVELVREALSYIPSHKARERLGFGHSPKWRESVLEISHRRAPFISMEKTSAEKAVVRLSADKMRDESKSKRGGGRPTDYLAENLPRSVLSAAQNADEARTAVLARSEMRSWRILQLEPSALRQPDDFQAPTRLDADGRHLAATLARLAAGDEARFFAGLSNQVSSLVSEVRSLGIDRDEVRRALQLVMRDKAGVELPASSLSDGTLRFIALCALAQDPTNTGVLCLEEPENGIHPQRMDAMARLLKEMVVDTQGPVDVDNPLRQVIVSTHSPLFASLLDMNDLLFADHRELAGQRVLVLRASPESWRAKAGASEMPLGEMLRYLEQGEDTSAEAGDHQGERVSRFVKRQLEGFGEL
jgi:predicted ATPase